MLLLLSYLFILLLLVLLMLLFLLLFVSLVVILFRLIVYRSNLLLYLFFAFGTADSSPLPRSSWSRASSCSSRGTRTIWKCSLWRCLASCRPRATRWRAGGTARSPSATAAIGASGWWVQPIWALAMILMGLCSDGYQLVIAIVSIIHILIIIIDTYE